MLVNPYLLFNGQCEEAFRFYEKVFGGKIEAMATFAGTPMEKQLPAGWDKKIIHARMTAAGQVLMGSDPPPGYYQPPQGFSVSLTVKEPAEVERIFRALAEGGNIKMPVQKTFWSAAYGMLVDRFAIPWMINCEQSG